MQLRSIGMSAVVASAVLFACSSDEDNGVSSNGGSSAAGGSAGAAQTGGTGATAGASGESGAGASGDGGVGGSSGAAGDAGNSGEGGTAGDGGNSGEGGAAGDGGNSGEGGAGGSAGLPRLCILPLGDSITQSNASHVSYRYWLWESLDAADYPFDFIGSLDVNHDGNPTYPDPSFDRDHEGHWGWRVDQVLSELPDWLGTYTPDVVLLHLGTNDAFQSNTTSSTVHELTQVIGALRAANAKVVVLLAKVIPTTDSNRQSRLADLNAEIDGLASSLTTATSPVVVVDQASGFDAVADTFDGVHPNEKGEKKMASKWLSALQAHWPAEGGVCDP